MNGESPFRVSRMVLTIACILSGITAASYLAAQFTPRRISIDQTTAAAEAQPVNLAEVQTTSIERSVSTSESERHSVPHICTPVTVHPMTVNIDNADIIREISRVHERLDLLSAEVRAAQVRATLHDTVATAPVQHSDVQPNERSSLEKVHDVPARLPSIPQLPAPNPVANVTSTVPSVLLRETFQPISVTDSVAAVALTPSPVSVPEAMPEIQFELAPHQSVPGIPIFEPPTTESSTTEPEAFEPEAVEPEAVEPEAVEPEAVEPESLLSIEFSTDVFAIPEPRDTFGITLQNDLQSLPIPASDFSDSKANIAAPVPVQWPMLPGVATLAVPSWQSAKRTTDPPFMKGRSPRVPAPQAQVANEPIGVMRRVSNTTQAAGKHTTQSDSQKCTVAKQRETPTYSNQAAAPLRAFRRIKSALSH